MKIALGTAQFGMNYGLSNLNGQTDTNEILSILKYAEDRNLNLLDTSPSYGNSEKVIGNAIINKNWRFVLKTPQFRDIKIDSRHVKILKNTFYNSLLNLKQSSVYGLLFHSCDDLLKPGGEILFKEMEKFKSQGFVNKIGVSVYNSEQINAILSRFKIDLIQIPFNIFDQQLLLDGWLEKIKNNNIEIHSRSSFLQGLLLMQPDLIPQYFLPIKKNIELLEELSRELSKNKLDLALGYVMSIPQIDQIIVGVNNLCQLKEMIDVKRLNLDPLDLVKYSINNPLFTNPSKWQL